jgi:hypothetical protein
MLGSSSVANGRFGSAVAIAALAAFLVGVSSVAAAGDPQTVIASSTQPVARTGSVKGPINVHGGSTLKQIAHMALPSGNWTVFAKGDLKNTTLAALTPRPVVCKLMLNGVSDRIQASPLGAGVDSSRESFLLTLSAHLTAGAAASLRCAAPTSTTGAIVVRWVRMVAVRTVYMVLGKIGGSTTSFGDYHSPRVVREVHSTGTITVPLGTEAEVGGIDLPDGAWSIHAKATILSGSGASNFANVKCTLIEGDYDRITASVGKSGQVADRLPIALQMVHQSLSPGHVALTCASSNAANNTRIRDIRITAFEGDLTNDNLGVTDAYPSPGVLAPVIDAGFDDGPTYIPATSSYDPIRDQKLPAGKWLVIGKAWLDNPASSYQPMVRCRLGPGSGDDTVELKMPVVGTADHWQPFQLIWSGSLATTSKVTLSCRSPDPGIAVHWIKLTAYKVSKLKTVTIR